MQPGVSVLGMIDRSVQRILELHTWLETARVSVLCRDFAGSGGSGLERAPPRRAADALAWRRVRIPVVLLPT